MGYYMGDYYARGGRARFMGDPGFFSFLGRLGKAAVGFIPGVGPIAKGAIDVATSAIGKIGSRAPAVLKELPSQIIKHPVISAAGGASVIGAAAAAIHHRGSMAAAGMGTSAGRMGHMGGRRHRRMNVCNPKALRRAIRRTHSFARLAMKTIHLVHPKKKASFGGFKHKKGGKK